MGHILLGPMLKGIGYFGLPFALSELSNLLTF